MRSLRKQQKSIRKWPFLQKIDRSNYLNIFNCLKMPDFGVNFVRDIKMNQPYQLQ